MSSRIQATGQVGMLALLLGALLPIWYWMIFEPAPLTNVQVQLIDKFSWAGGKFRVELLADVENKCPSVTTYSIVDSRGIEFVLNSTEEVPVGVFTVEVPKDAAAGMANYSQTTVFKCNPIRSHVVQTPKMEVYIVS